MVARIVGYLSPRNVAEDFRSDGQLCREFCWRVSEDHRHSLRFQCQAETLGPRCEQPATILRFATIGFCGLNRAFLPIPSRTRRTDSGGESGIRLLRNLLSLAISSTSPGTYTIAIVQRVLRRLTAVAGVTPESQFF